MAVTLINIARPPRPLTFNLDHVAHRKTLKFLQAMEGKRGETVFRRVGKELGDSLTLCARGTSGSSRGGLPDTILECSEVKAAIAAKLIRAERVADHSPKPARASRAKPSKPKAKPKREQPKPSGEGDKE